MTDTDPERIDSHMYPAILATIHNISVTHDQWAADPDLPDARMEFVDAATDEHDRRARSAAFFNHGMTLYGTPSDRYSMPIGTTVDIRTDGRGLFTVTRYNNTPLADEVLEAIRSGSVQAQSFSGRMVRSTPTPPRGGFRPTASGNLKTVRRTEIALRIRADAVAGLRRRTDRRRSWHGCLGRRTDRASRRYREGAPD
ncbi:HK97 family phage prohead protease [Protofrankia symbiont of Coriaria ruscifolia]|uniref:HK97 family phage prohead protease n=1 Tax=Protofrankia symbiont of Coriaria ruscifolia TaxID=1306542 RepID=UPI0010412C1A|nr:HK97 family phage prohead protease [Protofrankia symbiont of Coriaria ruscifolia]